MKNCPMCQKELAFKSQDIYCGRKCRAASMRNRRLKMWSKPRREIMDEKEKLRSAIKEIEACAKPLHEKLTKILQSENEAYIDTLMGKCFVYRRNCYSCPSKPEDYWDEFYQVKRRGKYGVVALACRKDSYGLSSIYEKELSVYSPDRGPDDLTPISNKEFAREYAKVLRQLMADVEK